MSKNSDENKIKEYAKIIIKEKNKDEIINALKTSYTAKEALQKLGYEEIKKNRIKVAKILADIYNVDISKYQKDIFINRTGYMNDNFIVIDFDYEKQKNAICLFGNVNVENAIKLPA